MPKLILGTAALLFVVASAFAQEYPARPVVMLVPFAAGGPTDTVARSLAQGMGSSSWRCKAAFRILCLCSV